MKRFGNLYSQIYDIDNIRLAHRNARKGKGNYSEVRMVDTNPEFYLQQIHEMLKEKTFRNAEYHVFKRMFGKKEREIFRLPYFPDRIIHHCIMQVLEPIWVKVLIRDTYSSIKGRGIHDGWRRVGKAMEDVEETQYCLKLDIKKFYPSVNHDILKRVIRQKVKCPDTLWLLDEIIDSTSGIPIGNYLSQYFGNIYLSGLDHYVKEQIGIKYYFRYCDDMVLLAPNKATLHAALEEIKHYTTDMLNLSIKSNYQIFPVDARGVDFLGYRFFHGFILVRKSIAQNFKRKVLHIRKSWRRLPFTNTINGIMSYYGWLKYADAKTLLHKYIDRDIRAILAACCSVVGQRNPLKEALRWQ